MKTNTIKINKGQYLADVISQIPSNAIIQKVLTGIGATYLEINTPRNSIIIEPNVPVIKGKRKSKKNKILGVLEGIYVPDIEAYLMNSTIIHKKIMTTPESFHKVKEAMERLGIDMYKDYFLMYDECDRTTADVDFRENIILPLENFFSFEDKAFVSATAVIPSDTRFEHYGFEVYKIEPQFDFSKPLNIVTTNNPLLALRESFKEIIKVIEGERVYIFFNSIIGIMSVIERANLHGKCAIFCSDGSGDKIKRDKGIKVYNDINESNFMEFNFFTSRFYSAVDININEPPHVIVFTDLNVAEHTMIDPYSDLIQISGRFRGINLASLTFISNQQIKLSYKSPKEAQEYLNGCGETYTTFQSLRDVASNEGARDLLTEALEKVTYSKFLTKDGEKNYFMIDNYFQKEKIKSLYADPKKWKEAFESVELKKQFNTISFEYNFKIPSYYPKVYGVQNFIETVKEVSNLLDILYEDEEVYSVLNKDELWGDIAKTHPEIVSGYQKLGKEKLCKNGYTKKHIQKAILEHDQSTGILGNFDFLVELDMTFNVGEFYDEKVIKSEFRQLIVKYNLPYHNKIKLKSDFERFYKLSSRTTRKKVKGYIIQEKKYN